MAGRRVATRGSLVLDSEGLVKLAMGDARARSYQATALARRNRVVISAITMAEVIRGGPQDSRIYRVLSRIAIVTVTPEIARQAGELLGATGLSGHRCAVDAVVAATALSLERPVVLLTSDLDDTARLVEESHRPKAQRIAVVHV